MIRPVLLSFLIVIISLPAQAGILDIKEVQSPSGINAWLVEDHSIPVISLRFSFRGSGSSNDTLEKQGLARMLSNTLDEGAGDLDSKAFQQRLSDLSISLSFSASRDYFSGTLKTLSKNREEAFELTALALTQPRFDQEAVDRMRLANLTRIKSDMTDPEWMAARLVNDVLFPGHPYSMNSGGTLTSLTRITPDDLRNKVKTDLTRDRLIVSVAGDITEAELGAVLDQMFGALPATSAAPQVAEAALSDKANTVLFAKDIPQTVIQMSVPGIDMKDPDYHTAEILNFVFGGAGFGSRLTDVVREQRGLTYGIYSGLTEMDHADLVTIGSSSQNATAKELIDLTRSEMTRIAQAPVTDKELKDAKTYLIGSVPLDLTSTDRISGYMLAFQAERLPTNYLDIREEALNKVTAADVQRVAARLLDPAKMTVILVGQPEGITPDTTVTKLPNVD